MKKSWLAILILVIFCTCLVAGTVFSVGADPMITAGQTWDFEDGQLPGTAADFADDGFEVVGSVAVAEGGANGSAYALGFTAADSKIHVQVSGLKANTLYKFTCMAKNTGSNPLCFVVAKNDLSSSTFAQILGDWQQYTCYYRTGADETSMFMYVHNIGTANSLIDDLKVTEYTGDNLMGPGWDFESGSLTDIGTVTDSGGDGFWLDGTDVTVVAGGANDTAYAMQVGGNLTAFRKIVYGLQPNTKYILSAWVKGAAVPGGASALVAADWDPATAAMGTPTLAAITQGDWQKVRIEYTTGAAATSAIIYAQNYADGTTILLDDIALKAYAATTPQYTAPYQVGTIWDMETGNLPGTAADIADDGFETIGVVELVDGGAGSSDYSVKLSGADSKLHVQVNNLKPNTLYKYTCMAKNSGTDPLCFAVASNDGSNLTFAQVGNSATWQEYTCYFRTGASETGMLMYFHNIGNAVSQVDNICVTEYTGDNLMGPGWDFESGSLADIGTVTDSGGDGFWLDGTDVTVVSGGANASNYAMQVGGNLTAFRKIVYGLQPNTKYILSAWVKGAAVPGGASALAIVDWNGNITGNPVFTGITQGDWQQVSLEYTTGSNITSALVYAQNYADGTTILLDDIKLVKYVTPHTYIAPYKVGDVWDMEDGYLPGTSADITDDGFEAVGSVETVAGGANNSGYAMHLTGADSKVHVQINNLKPNTLYKYTCMAKNSGTDPLCFAVAGNDLSNLTYAQVVGDWQQYTCYFRTGDDQTSMLMYYHNIGNANSLVDDICVTEYTGDNLMGPGWDFEGGSLADIGTVTDAGGDGFWVEGSTVSVVSGGGNGSDYAMQLQGNLTAFRKIVYGLEPETSYKLTAWVKGVSVSGDASALAIVDWNGAVSGNPVFTGITQGDWQQVSLLYTTGTNITSALVYAQNYSDTTLLVDDVQLIEYVEPPHEYIAPYKVGDVWDMEDGYLPGTSANIADDGFEAIGTVEAAAGGANGSGYAMHLSGADSKVHISVTGLKPNTLYKYTAMVKNSGSDPLCFAVANGDLSGLTYAQAVGPWQQYICYFRTGAEQTSMLMYFHNIGNANSLVDDICVTEYTGDNLMGPGWDFETGSFPGTLTDAGGDGLWIDGTEVSIVSGGAEASSYAAQVKGNLTALRKIVYGLKPSTNYQLTAWVKGVSVPGDASALAIADWDAATATVGTPVFTGISQGQWEQVKLNFTTGSDSTAVLIYVQNYSDATILVDDLLLKEHAGAFYSGEAPYQLGKTWGFETGLMPGTENDYTDDGFEIVGTADIVSGGAKGSKYAMKLSGVDSKMHILVGGLEPNTLYKYTCMAKNTGSDPLFFAVAGSDLHNLTFAQITEEGWSEYTCYYRTGDKETSMLLYFQNTGEKASLVDNIQVTAYEGSNLMGPGWDFEEGDFSQIGTQTDAGGDGFRTEGKVSVASGGVNGSDYAMKISGKDAGFWKLIYGLEPNSNYQLTAWIKGSSVPGDPSALAITDYYVDSGKTGKPVYAEIYKSGWQKVVIDFTTGKNATTALVYAQNYSNATILIDDITLKSYPGAFHSGQAPLNPGEKWTFESGLLPGSWRDFTDDGFETVGTVYVTSGGAEGSKYAARLIGADSKMHISVTKLQPNTLYKFTCMAKNTGNDPLCFAVAGEDLSNLTFAQITDSDWQEYTCYYRTGAKQTTMLLYFHNIGEGDSKVDNITVTAYAGDNLMGPGWDFEEGDFSELGTVTDAGGDGFWIDGNVSIVSGGADGSDYAMLVKGKDSAFRKLVYGLQPGTQYYLTAWVKGASVPGDPSALTVADWNIADAIMGTPTFMEIGEGDWQKVVLPFTTGKDTTAVLVYLQNYCDAEIYIDDIQILEGATAPVLYQSNVVEEPVVEAPAADVEAETEEVPAATEGQPQEEKRGFPWWILLLILMIVTAVTAILVIKSRNQTGKYGK